MIGLSRVVLATTVGVLSPLLQRDPDVYRSRVVGRLAKRYVFYSILAKKESNEEKKTRALVKAVAARASLWQLPVSPHVIDELDLAVNLATLPKEASDGESK